jgi:AbrB family looped-hinge helix DNA binding protein
MIATLSKGQQITIPASIRDALGLHIGSRLEIEQTGEKIILKPLGDDLEILFEASKKIKPKQKLTAEQMDEFNERMFS